MTNEPDQQEELKQYWQHRRTNRNALVVLAGSIAAIIVFRGHHKWGDGQLAYAAYVAAHVVGAVGALAAYRANGMMQESRGYLRGKFGSAPTSEAPRPPS